MLNTNVWCYKDSTTWIYKKWRLFIWNDGKSGCCLSPFSAPNYLLNYLWNYGDRTESLCINPWYSGCQKKKIKNIYIAKLFLFFCFIIFEINARIDLLFHKINALPYSDGCTTPTFCCSIIYYQLWNIPWQKS